MRIAWFSAWPESPDWSTFTFMPVCFVKAASTGFETANESWVTSVIVGDDAAPAVTPGNVDSAAESTATSSTSVTGRFTGSPFRGR